MSKFSYEGIMSFLLMKIASVILEIHMEIHRHISITFSRISTGSFIFKGAREMMRNGLKPHAYCVI